MIRHIVLLRFRENVPKETRAALMGELDALRGHLQGVAGFHAGPNVSVETPVIHGFHDGFWFDFVDAAARDAYLVDPAHQAVGGRIVANTVAGAQGVVVFDVEV